MEGFKIYPLIFTDIYIPLFFFKKEEKKEKKKKTVEYLFCSSRDESIYPLYYIILSSRCNFKSLHHVLNIGTLHF